MDSILSYKIKCILYIQINATINNNLIKEIKNKLKKVLIDEMQEKSSTSSFY